MCLLLAALAGWRLAYWAFDADLNTVGLRYRDGRPKPGYDALRTLNLR